MLIKSRVLWAIVVIAGIAAVGYQTSHAENNQVPPLATRWEYQVLSLRAKNLSLQQANTMGQNGWELIEVIPNGDQVQFYFKRPR